MKVFVSKIVSRAIKLGYITDEQVLEIARRRGNKVDEQDLVTFGLLKQAQVDKIRKMLEDKPAAKVPAWALPAAIGAAALVFITLSVVLVLRLFGSRPEPTPARVARTEPPPQPKEEKLRLPLPEPDPRDHLHRHSLKLTDLEDELPVWISLLDSPLDKSWNAVADDLLKAKSASQLTEPLERGRKLQQQVSKEKHLDIAISETLDPIAGALTRRRERQVAKLRARAELLAEQNKYQEALRTLQMAPGDIDTEPIRKAIVDRARAAWTALKAQTEQHVRDKRFREARNALMQGIAIDLPEVQKEAYRALQDLAKQEDEAARKRDQEDFERMEKELLAQKEIEPLIESLRKSLWELLAKRRFADARKLVEREEKSERAKQEAYAGRVQDYQALVRAIGDMYAFVTEQLLKEVERPVSLLFQYDLKGKPVTRNHIIKTIRDGTIVFTLGMGEIEDSLYFLHSSEIVRLTRRLKDDRAPLFRGVAYLLFGEFEKAYSELMLIRAAGPMRFIEDSSVFLVKMAPELKKRARELFDAGKFSEAIGELSRLVLVPAERAAALKMRARAHYMTENFVAAMFDLETLFEMKVLDKDLLALLNQIYQRANFLDRTVKLYVQAREKFPDDADLAANLARLYMQTHDYANAQKVLDSVPRSAKGHPGVASVAHLLRLASKDAFEGQPVYRMSWGRYDVETNESQDAANDVARFMDQVYQEYAKVFPYRKNESLRFHVKVFKTEEQFGKYFKAITGRAHAGPGGKVLGFYLDITKELVVFRSNAGGGPDTNTTLRHEGFHQYLDYFVSGSPSWFNEGFASYFETSTADEAKMNPLRHNPTKQAIQQKKLPGMKELMMMDHAEFLLDPRVGLFYGQAWSFIFYLVQSGRKSLLDDYFEELMAGRNQKEAFENSFGKTNFAALEEAWKQAVLSDHYGK